MKKALIITFIVLMLIVLLLASNLKQAYKVLPVKTNEKLTAPEFAEWKEFVPKSKRFKVMLPIIPQYAKETIPIPDNLGKYRRYEMYVSQQLSGPILMISLITYPDEINIKDDKFLLEEAVQEMKETKPDNSLKELKHGTYLGFPSVDFSFGNAKYKIMGKAFLVKKTVYLMTYAANEQEFNEEEYKKFFDSFTLLPNVELQKATELKKNAFPPIQEN